MENERSTAFTSKGCASLRYLLGGAIAGGVLSVFVANTVIESPTLAQNLLAFIVGDAVGGTLVLLAMGLDYRRNS